eukprot:TRINITY_DN20532_c0_g1_i1.p1 TRINITY_DN20532_c0_g1~~TRINITY_DN20532_c0_g1_i1.p1  ORF type:complete len:423 (-),score=23.62 TRINITY_DN20532_c0_g1_i1:83-1309(-)
MERWLGLRLRAIARDPVFRRIAPGIGQQLRDLERHPLLQRIVLGDVAARAIFVYSAFRLGCYVLRLIVTNGKLARVVLLFATAYTVIPYALRLRRLTWLRKEWIDFFKQVDALACFGRGYEEISCPICTEDLRATPWHVLVLPCCQSVLCWRCLRQHAESVVNDARPEMLCPLAPCRTTLPDTLVKTAVRREQWSWPSTDITGTLARRKARAYDRWSVARGLASSCSARLEDIVHCASVDCGHMWVLPTELRRQKAHSEPGSSWNPRSWSLGRLVGLYSPVKKDGIDLRHVSCPKCKRDFCLLCGLPWRSRTLAHADHDGKSCVEHTNTYPKTESGALQWAGAKACPGCSAPTIRSAGCNHMTCTQCRTEWCWVCRSKWSSTHYRCTESATTFQGAGQVAGTAACQLQ